MISKFIQIKRSFRKVRVIYYDIEAVDKINLINLMLKTHCIKVNQTESEFDTCKRYFTNLLLHQSLRDQSLFRFQI